MADLSTPTNDGQSEQTAESLITQHIDIWTTAIEQKSSAGRGTSNKFSLYGIKKLRELILELAVRGKLVPQDPNDEPASVLLKRIAAEKALLVKEGKLKKQKPLPEISDDEKPFGLPNGWEFVQVGSVINRLSNGFSGTQNKDSNGYPLSRIESISDSVVNMNKIGFSPNIPIEKLDYYRLEKGDILLSHINSDFHVGKTAIYDGTNELYHGVNLLLLRVSRLVFNEYINLAINQLRLSGYFLSVAQHAIGQSSINQSILQSILITLPPLEEQHRIVAKVDELMSLCDALEAQTETSIAAHQTLVETLLNALLLPNTTQPADSQSASTAPALIPSVAESFAQSWQRVAEHFDTLFTTEASIDTLKQTILQLAVMGKLVPQDANDEPAAKLLERIASEKAQLIKDGKIKKQKPLPAITDEEKPFELPKSWEWCRFNDAIDVRDGTHDSPKDATGSNTFPLITSKNFINGKIDFDNARQISSDDHFEIIKRSQVDKLDILFSMIGGNIGNQVIVEDERDFSIKNVALFKYYDTGYTYPYFVFLYTQNLAKDLQTKAIGGAQPFISLGSLRSLLFALPPLEEQHRIVTKVDELMALCDQLKARLSDAQTTQLHLTDAIVEQAV